MTPGALHLDTSFLIRALVPGSDEAGLFRTWLRDGRPLSMSTVAWGEFLCGPLDEAAATIAARLVRRHAPLGVEEAATAARLFNGTGRRRGSFADCLVAATALVEGAALATSDQADFRRFEIEGLRLEPPVR